MIANATSSIGSYFFTGTLNVTLIAIVVLSVAYSAWMELRNRRFTSKEEIIG
jgi:putative tricarboxylic transport membrane protein